MDLTENPLSDLEERLVAVAADHGYRPSHVTKKAYELEHPGHNVVVYVNRERTPQNVIAVFIHPETELTSLSTVAGVVASSGPVHQSNLRRFPKKINNGREPSAYGYSIECADFSSFGRLLDWIPSSSGRP